MLDLFTLWRNRPIYPELKHPNTSIRGNVTGKDNVCYANYGNSNLNHRIKIQGGAQEEWEGGFAKV